jgi:hypothetical protein
MKVSVLSSAHLAALGRARHQDRSAVPLPFQRSQVVSANIAPDRTIDPDQPSGNENGQVSGNRLQRPIAAPTFRGASADSRLPGTVRDPTCLTWPVP